MSPPRIGSSPRIGVAIFPGTLDDRDAARAVAAAGGEPVALWHDDADLRGVDAVILPGGFSYGDYLRCGAIARFAPLMDALVPAAQAGLPVLGICNGFQILCEAHLLPGALMRNSHLRFRYRPQRLRVESGATSWTSGYDVGAEIVVPVKNIDGRFAAAPDTVRRLEDDGRIVCRYVGGNPNGSIDDIAGISNERGNVVGLMPHPEHAIDPVFGPSADGLGFFTSVMESLAGATA